MTGPAEILPAERECPYCGLFQSMPALEEGDALSCKRCHAGLRHQRRDSLGRSLACAVAALVLLIVAVQLPFLDIRAIGRTYSATLFTGPSQLDFRGMWEISLVVLVTLVIMPPAYLIALITVLVGIRLPDPPPFLARLFGILEKLRPWAMIEVFLLGVFVAYTRLKAIAEVDPGPALLAFGGVMLAMVAADAELDRDAVWEDIEKRGLVQVETPPGAHLKIGCDVCGLVLRAPRRVRCPRCGWRLERRKRLSLVRTWALVIASAALYLPANFLPIISVTRWGQGHPSTILGGVLELIDYGMLPLALLVFCASIFVPILKLAGLIIMLLATQAGSVTRLRDRTRLYRIIETIGRWSMIDVFMLTVLVALVRLGYIATVLPEPGAVAFAAVVILTMLASASFDPRLMWDAAARAGHDLDAEDLETQRRKVAAA